MDFNDFMYSDYRVSELLSLQLQQLLVQDTEELFDFLAHVGDLF